MVLRCSHASVFAATEAMESLSKLTALTSLRMGPNPEDIFPHCSPLGFPRLPSFVGSLSRLQQIDISMADSATVASLSAVDFTPIQHIPVVKLTLRADTSIRAVAHLPPSISRVSGLSQLAVQVNDLIASLSLLMVDEKSVGLHIAGSSGCTGLCRAAAAFVVYKIASVPAVALQPDVGGSTPQPAGQAS